MRGSSQQRMVSAAQIIKLNAGIGRMNFPLNLQQDISPQNYSICQSVQSLNNPGVCYYLTSNYSFYKDTEHKIQPTVMAAFNSSTSLYLFPNKIISTMTIWPPVIEVYANKLEGDTLAHDDTYNGIITLEIFGFRSLKSDG